MPDETYRIGELAELAGVTRRTVHYYINKGLIPPAEGAGVNSFYNTDHLNRIRLIRKLQESYLPLDEIRRIVTPLEPSEIAEHLEQYDCEQPPAGGRILAQETLQGEIDEPAGSRRLYEKVDLGGHIELHFPTWLRKEKPALIHSLVEKAREILRDR